jgi:hypothetical protein
MSTESNIDGKIKEEEEDEKVVIESSSSPMVMSASVSIVAFIDHMTFTNFAYIDLWYTST